MGDKNVVACKRGSNEVAVTLPWFVDGAEYGAQPATHELLINGEKAFAAVYDAIKNAKKTVSIICWGFQPSMYFKRGAEREKCIGELLEEIAGREKDPVRVRILCWAIALPVPIPYLYAINLASLTESNSPGRWNTHTWADKPPYSTPEQYAYDKLWYQRYDEQQESQDVAAKQKRAEGDNDESLYQKGGSSEKVSPEEMAKLQRAAKNISFHGRGFDLGDRAHILFKDYVDKDVSTLTRLALAASVSHHQKMVLVDHEDPENAIGFVMGHNMLDTYWDNDAHSAKRSYLLTGKPEDDPGAGPNGIPFHDFSSRVTGPIVGDLFANFAQAWQKETDETLPKPNFANYPLRPSLGLPSVAQILRTQPQYKKEHIKELYLQAVNNALQFIHIENQYFRWPPLADKIVEHAQKLCEAGRKPEEHKPLYLFVITNSSDAGMGMGAKNSYRMMDKLGRADVMPGVAKLEKPDDVEAKLGEAKNDQRRLQKERKALDKEGKELSASGKSSKDYDARVADNQAETEKNQAKIDELQQRSDELKQENPVIKPEEVPGLKVHICTLVSPDTPEGKDWNEVYVHAKLMTIDDTFITAGSANINTRSMQVDSEMNITHHNPLITGPARQALWDMHLDGSGRCESPEGTFKMWKDYLEEQAGLRDKKKMPIARLAPFLRTSDSRANLD